MKLTLEQIQQLYIFTRQHYVEHFDVQTELVDHLANDIEQIWKTQPNLSFEDARNISFKKFGVFGFMDIVGERQKALSKKYWKIIWSFAKDWFQLPKIILTIFIFTLFTIACRSKFGEYFLFSSLMIMCVYGLIKAFQLKNNFKKRIKSTGKKWMLEEMIFSAGMGFFTMIPINLINIFNLSNLDENMIYSNWFTLLYAAIFTLLVIGFYVVIEVLPKKAEELLTKNYPEYKLV
ncbi:hypothetical protein [Lutibacter maritimus]|uniref:Uncharacterized protein n=1 Tax=Lutibacter maritimus TaxID=593133 RepID=A0A1I6PHY5_9FLAO|nr:hypothetical protein [Lutibacter maritimus]SFS39790.1 hypothetical protein SAMN04488006_1051 [Lutibacter maritimus]